MSAIITQKFRKNNIQNLFDDMTAPSVAISACSGAAGESSITLGSTNHNIQPGMIVQTIDLPTIAMVAAESTSQFPISADAVAISTSSTNIAQATPTNSTMTAAAGVISLTNNIQTVVLAAVNALIKPGDFVTHTNTASTIGIITVSAVSSTTLTLSSTAPFTVPIVGGSVLTFKVTNYPASGGIPTVLTVVLSDANSNIRIGQIVELMAGTLSTGIVTVTDIITGTNSIVIASTVANWHTDIQNMPTASGGALTFKFNNASALGAPTIKIVLPTANSNIKIGQYVTAGAGATGAFAFGTGTPLVTVTGISGLVITLAAASSTITGIPSTFNFRSHTLIASPTITLLLGAANTTMKVGQFVSLAGLTAGGVIKIDAITSTTSTTLITVSTATGTFTAAPASGTIEFKSSSATGLQTITVVLNAAATMAAGQIITGGGLLYATGPITVSASITASNIVILTTTANHIFTIGPTSGAPLQAAAIVRLSDNTIVASVSGTAVNLTLPLPAALSNVTLNFYDQYYIGIGKSDPFYGDIDGTDLNPTAPTSGERTSIEALNNLLVLKKIITKFDAATSPAIMGDAGYVVPRVNWIYGNYYKSWDPMDPTCLYPTTAIIAGSAVTLYPCYAINDNKIFICARRGYNEAGGIESERIISKDAPIASDTIGTPSAALSDKYIWVWIANIGLDLVTDINQSTISPSYETSTPGFLDSSQFVKVYRNTSTTTSVPTKMGATVSAGKIYSYRIIAGGIGFVTGDAFKVIGDGTTDATGTIIATGGAITGIVITSVGDGCTAGSVVWTSGIGTDEILIPCISPPKGFGHDVVADLSSWFAGFGSTFGAGDIVYPTSADLPISNAFRQISLIRNPIVIDSNGNNTFRCLKYIRLNGAAPFGPFDIAPGDVIENTTANARGWVDYYDAVNKLIYYHQNNSSFIGIVGIDNSVMFQIGNKPFIDTGTINYLYKAASNFTRSSVLQPYDITIPIASFSTTTGSSIITLSGSIPQIIPGMGATAANITGTAKVISNTYYKIGNVETTEIKLSANVTTTTTGTTTVTFSNIGTTKGQTEYVPGSGEVIFLQNRNPIYQNTSQTEQVSLIVQF